MMSRGTVKRSYNKPSLLVTLLLMSIITATLNSDQNFEAISLSLSLFSPFSRPFHPSFPPLGTQSVLHSVKFLPRDSFFRLRSGNFRVSLGQFALIELETALFSPFSLTGLFH